MNQRLIILNLISILVTAFALTTFLHEFAHAIVATLLDANPTLFHNYVSIDISTVPSNHELFILSAGPLASFFQAVLFLTLLRRKNNIDFIGLFYLWMGIIGAIVFLGYIIMGSLMPYGDIGRAYTILAIPPFVSFSFSTLALIGIVFFFRKLRLVFISFLSELRVLSGFEKIKSLYVFFVLPLVVSTIINALNSLPVPTVMSLAFPLLLPFTLLPSAIRISKSNWDSGESSAEESEFSKITYWPTLSMILMIIISRILATGINI